MTVLNVNGQITTAVLDDAALRLDSVVGAGGTVYVSVFGEVSHTTTAGTAIASYFADNITLQIDGRVASQLGRGVELEGSNHVVTIGTGGYVTSGIGQAITFQVFSDPGMNNTVLNNGTIIGDVSFDYGSNLYDGRNGRIIGAINLGADNDVVWGGALGETVNDFSRGILGISGDDFASLGFGNDLYHYSSGYDSIDGGAGIDTFDARFLSVSYNMTIDLTANYAENADGELVELFSFENATATYLDDRLIGSANNNILRGEEGVDTISGLGGNDRLFGGNDNDLLDGGTGADQLSGGAGKDQLTGGAGNDRFVFANGDTGVAVAARDIITDFTIGQDKINLRAVDANVATVDDDNFAFTTGAFGASAPGQLRVVVSGLNTFVYLNFDADAAIDAAIQVNGVLALTAADFIL